MASRNHHQIRCWWSKWPNANIGLIAPEDVVIVDVDERSGGLSLLEELQKEHGNLPHTAAVTSGGGGLHFYFRHAVDDPITSRSVGRGLELKKTIIAPPSLHRSGRRYQWRAGSSLMSTALAPLPSWIHMEANTPVPGHPLTFQNSAVIQSGERNETLFRTACSLRARGYSDLEIWERLVTLNESCIPPLSVTELRAIATTVHRYPVPDAIRSLALNDDQNATWFSEQLKGELRFVPERRTWIRWNGRSWSMIDADAVLRAAGDVVRNNGEFAKTIDDQEVRRRLTRFAEQSGNASRLRATENLARAHLAISSEELDQEPFLLNLANGTVDLRTGSLEPPDPNYWLTHELPISYDATARASRWQRFIKEITSGEDELAEFLQRVVGYALTGSAREQVAFFLHGPGANGKTTFLEVIRGLMGPLARQTPRSTLLAHNTDNVRGDLARLAGARFVTASEVEDGDQISEVLLKQLTGNDRIVARELYKPHTEHTPTYKIFVVGNHLPIIRGRDEGIWRRILVIPFRAHIRADRRDPDLMAKLRDEIPGVLKWAVQGCLDWQKQGLNPPAMVLDATNRYRANVDTVQSFLNARCVVGPKFEEEQGVLYAAYRRWCVEAQVSPKASSEFGKALGAMGLATRRTKNTRYRSGLKLKPGLK